ncbi:hypothetical protein BJ138DRAFT_386877 [Hygrophoropsis aurantiaca]|uniref:Uncharacterized protein n=1 Tax=Hygrophoropsis aurantiaca TaxID=72124 RepID=A0ACB8AMK6_9AGAM|nr:hypothetical protein BJ138DRAFT_386877 [Hygrophoropsis aurantiaca]
MANIDKTDTGLSDLNPSNGPAIAQILNSSPGDSANKSADEPPVKNSDLVSSDKSSNSPNSASPANSAAPSRPSPASGLSNPHTPLTVPHPKKFSAVNINKKFLQKNSGSAGSASISSNLITAKSGSPVPRPTTQSLNSHSRLVAAKLTATPQLSTTTGPGWSRPSSATPPVSASPSTSSNVPPSHPAPPLPASIPAAPQLPHAGKVIQPQPRAAAATATTARKNGPSKPAWGNANAAASSLAENAAANEFPTAAEVAHGSILSRKAKVADVTKTNGGPPSKQVSLEEADTFRGVHLNPNAHHWDEMEEDGDDFLGGVIEFGDGRQYKISPADIPPPQTSVDASGVFLEAGDISLTSDGPVSKEERFADDFDRSWPRSKTSTSVTHHDSPSHAMRQASSSPTSSHPSRSPSESSRVLFNERSNRLEPYSSSNSASRHAFAAGPQPPGRRGSHFDASLSPVDNRGGRDIPPQSPVQPVQLLQKPPGSIDVPRGRGFANGYSSGSFAKPRDKDGMPHHSPNVPTGQGSGRGRELHTSFAGRDRRDSAGEGRSRLLSNMGPPQLPGSFRDTSRQHPPHLPQVNASLPPRRLSSREPASRASSVAPGESPKSLGVGNALVASPVLSQASIHSEAPAPLSTVSVDLEDAHKTAMHLSAERAKQRRQREEEEREKEKDRARRKAAELEEKMKTPNEAKKPVDQEEAIQIIESAVSAVKQIAPEGLELPKSQHSDIPGPKPSALRAQSGRPPSLKPIPRPTLSNRPPPTPNTAGMDHPSTAGQVESWRSKANPLPPSTPARKNAPLSPSTPRHPVAHPAAPQPPPMLHAVEEPVTAVAGENLEEVDFADIGKFVGTTESSSSSNVLSASERKEEGPTRPPRPVASDFFEDASPLSKSTTDAWRRKTSADFRRPSRSGSVLSQDDVRSLGKRRDSETATSVSVAAASLSDITAPSTLADTSIGESHASGQVLTVPSLISPQQRTPRTATSYREAPMSALDDVISRIKGALDNMHAVDPSKDSSSLGSLDPDTSISSLKINSQPLVSVRAIREPRWLPPALRPRQFNFDQDQEVFDVTRCEPPRSPKPAWNAFIVRIPGISRPMEPMSKKQAHYAKNTTGLLSERYLVSQTTGVQRKNKISTVPP